MSNFYEIIKQVDMAQNKILVAMFECHKGSNYKLDYEAEINSLQLSKVLPADLNFPFDFGMIRGANGDDAALSMLFWFWNSAALKEDMSKIEKVYIERNGEIISIRK